MYYVNNHINIQIPIILFDMELGFIILRHVNSEISNNYWIICYNQIRKFYPNHKILLIDDNSNYDLISKDIELTMTNTTIIQSEHKGCGEILPYYYYLSNKLFDIAVIIHDSVFIQRYIDFGTKNRLIWEFEHHWDNVVDEHKMIRELNNNDELIEFYNNKSLWKGCFGTMTVINYDFLQILEHKYKISNLVKYITCRQDRMALERVFGCLFTKENLNYTRATTTATATSMLGNIHQYCCVGQYYQWYIENRIHDDPMIKLWSGR
jgi:hypothetical protein